MGKPKGSLGRGPPMRGHLAGLWQHLISESGHGRRSQGLWEHDPLAASIEITVWLGALVAKRAGG